MRRLVEGLISMRLGAVPRSVLNRRIGHPRFSAVRRRRRSGLIATGFPTSSRKAVSVWESE